MMSVEALLTALVGIVLGTGVAAGALIPLGPALDGSVLTGGPAWLHPAIVGTSAALTFVAVPLPTSVALRAKPVEAAVAP